MKTTSFSSYLHDLLFPGQAADFSHVVGAINTLLKHGESFGSGQKNVPLIQEGLRQHGIQALVQALSDIQVQQRHLLDSLREKEARVVELEDKLDEMKSKHSELINTVDIHEKQLQKYQETTQQNALQRQELETLLSGVVKAIEQNLNQSVVPAELSKDTLNLAEAIQAALMSMHERAALRQRQQEAERDCLVTALQQVARGEIPKSSMTETPNASDDMLWIRNAAITLQEIYAGNASVSTTIHASMEMLFGIAHELADGAAQQMGALQELQQTVSQMSQNTVNMACQTDENAKIAQEIHLLTDSLMNEAEEMIAAVRESYKNIEDINDLMDQSSLLALNARIIAAQAGEHGRGFAVVAEAIKDLSAQTDTFVQLITEGVQAITKSTTTVHEGVQRIAQSMGEVQQNTDQVASGAHEYSVSAQQMMTSVEHILTRAQDSAHLAKQLSSMAKRISIALEQLTEMTQFFEQSNGAESDIYRSGDTGDRAAPISGIATLQELRKKRLAAIFINKGPADQIHEYQMQQEAERQHLQLKIYSGENNARISVQIAERLITGNSIDILFWQVTNNLTLHKILHLAKQRHVLVIPFGHGGNVTKEQVPFQTLIQHYEEGRVAAEYLPKNSAVYAILGPEHLSVANTRAQGFLWNLPAGCRSVGNSHGDWTVNEASILMKSFLDEHGQGAFDAIYGINDSSAFGAMRACLEHIILELVRHHKSSWGAKHVIGTDVSEEMLQCMHGTQGRKVLYKMLEKVISAPSMDGIHLSLEEHADGWAVRWEKTHEAVFSIRDGEISVSTQAVKTVLISNIVTISYSTFFDEAGQPIGVGAMALRHLIDCVQNPGQAPYIIFSREQGVTKETPESIWKTLRYVLTDVHTQWRNEHVLSLSSQNEFVCVGEL